VGIEEELRFMSELASSAEECLRLRPAAAAEERIATDNG
jgi:hypothetical protein